MRLVGAACLLEEHEGEADEKRPGIISIEQMKPACRECTMPSSQVHRHVAATDST